MNHRNFFRTLYRGKAQWQAWDRYLVANALNGNMVILWLGGSCACGMVGWEEGPQECGMVVLEGCCAWVQTREMWFVWRGIGGGSQIDMRGRWHEWAANQFVYCLKNVKKLRNVGVEEGSGRRARKFLICRHHHANKGPGFPVWWRKVSCLSKVRNVPPAKPVKEYGGKNRW